VRYGSNRGGGLVCGKTAGTSGETRGAAAYIREGVWDRKRASGRVARRWRRIGTVCWTCLARVAPGSTVG